MRLREYDAPSRVVQVIRLCFRPEFAPPVTAGPAVRPVHYGWTYGLPHAHQGHVRAHCGRGTGCVDVQSHSCGLKSALFRIRAFGGGKELWGGMRASKGNPGRAALETHSGLHARRTSQSSPPEGAASVMGALLSMFRPTGSNLSARRALRRLKARRPQLCPCGLPLRVAR